MAIEAGGLPGRRHLLAGVIAAAIVAVGGVGFGIATLARPGSTPRLPSIELARRLQPARAQRPSRSRRRSRALRVVAVSPPNASTGVRLHADVVVRFSAPLAGGAMARLVPPVPGAWHRDGPDAVMFVPRAPYVPDATEHVVIDPGRRGPRSRSGARLVSAFASKFTVRDASMLRVNELLAELDYLPWSFVPSGMTDAAAIGGRALAAEATNPWRVGRTAAPGTFVPRFPAIPAQLAAAFDPTGEGVATQGAVMAFEADHGLAPDGIVGPKVWRTLLDAVAQHDATTRPYDYLIVTETEPETLYVWRDGRVILQSPTNTGVPGATTALGTYPVYLRYTSTTMSGTNPNGTYYSDPGVPWVAYFNGGDAVHGFLRPGYGYPQSDGCVELPYATAQAVFATDPIGTLVTVTTGDLSAQLHAAPPQFILPPPPPKPAGAPDGSARPKGA